MTIALNHLHTVSTQIEHCKLHKDKICCSVMILDFNYDSDLPNKRHYTLTTLSINYMGATVHSLPLSVSDGDLHDL